MGEENFLKKVFLPPHPQLSKTLLLGKVFIFICALDGCKATVGRFLFAKKILAYLIKNKIINWRILPNMVSTRVNRLTFL